MILNVGHLMFFYLYICPPQISDKYDIMLFNAVILPKYGHCALDILRDFAVLLLNVCTSINLLQNKTTRLLTTQ